MGTRILNERDYYRIVYGGWLGKNIGGTLGAPVEGVKQKLELTFYPKLPDGPLENDDLDLQLVWLHALEQYGPGLTCRELGQEWVDHIFFPFDEYGYGLTNLRKGLQAPVSGSFNNPFRDCMGSPIRSEIWAMAAPGAPDVAAYYAYQDSAVDHAGGEGVYGEVFFAAIESAIFYERDRDRLIEIGLRYIPEQCRTSLAVRDLVGWHREGIGWEEARALIQRHHGDDNFTDAPQNIAFTILGWLYGENFEDAILKAVNCGYDTDCTAATIGAILGMLLGPEGLPDRWVKPVGDRVVVSAPIKGFPAPSNLEELTRRTIQAGKRVLAFWDTGIVVLDGQPTDWTGAEAAVTGKEKERKQGGSGAASASVMQAHLATELEYWRTSRMTENRYALPQGSVADPNVELRLDFGAEGPAIGLGGTVSFELTFANRSRITQSGRLALELPEGFTTSTALPAEVQLEPGEAVRWTVAVTNGRERPEPAYELAVAWSRRHDGHGWSVQRVPFALFGAAHWTVWGPADAASTEGTAIACPGNRIAWPAAMATASAASAAGRYRASTRLEVPSARSVRLIVAADGPIRASLDGRPVIDCPAALEFMPAYHRAPKEQHVELELAAGTYRLDVEAEPKQPGVPPRVYVLPVALRTTTSPGPHYYYTDVQLLPLR
ncbi:ADP-ribosylglycohydrolase family protein [Paenibacillus sp. HJGM_3]|uniref:ADP-ribosylglycohydrolase family protein n=1 Tax=Paenibacillus sp. HJGM_3 TaxID=3379816 RepID=UPI0038589FFC